LESHQYMMIQTPTNEVKCGDYQFISPNIVPKIEVTSTTNWLN